jgi:hypothetical protein
MLVYDYITNCHATFPLQMHAITLGEVAAILGMVPEGFATRHRKRTA